MKRRSKDSVEIVDSSVNSSAVEPILFDIWFDNVKSHIPRHHTKHIIKAFFVSIGLSDCEPAEKFNDALKKYGLIINP